MSKRINFLIILFYLFIFSAHPTYAEVQEEAVITDIKWQGEEHLLSYNLSKDAMVKIRAGSYTGPVYRAIVNLEKRPKGQNQEHWDGKDEEGKIDFLKYGKAHFCVDAPVKPLPDSLLEVRLSEGANPADKITIDIEENRRTLFAAEKGELRVYVDNKLNKIEKVASFPFTFSVKTYGLEEGSHLVTLNLWPSLNFVSVAYNSFQIEVPKKPALEQKQGKIAFSKQDETGFWQIFTFSLDGKDIKQLTKTPVDKRYPCWSPEAKRIAYCNNLGELWVIDSEGKPDAKISLPVSCSEPKFSPEGKSIIFTSLEDVYHGSTKIWELDLATFQLKKLVNRPWLQYNPSFSPDGAQVIFTDGPELFGQNIQRLDFKTGDITQLTDNGAYDYDMQGVFLNSGQEIVYSTNETGDYEIFKMDKFGRDKKNLSQSRESSEIMPQATKDDAKIFFLSDRGGNFQIWQMNIDGSQSQQVTQGSAINSFSIYTE